MEKGEDGRSSPCEAMEEQPSGQPVAPLPPPSLARPIASSADAGRIVIPCQDAGKAKAHARRSQQVDTGRERRVSRLRQRLAFRAWRQAENIPRWQRRVQQAMARLTAPLQWAEGSTGAGDAQQPLDISAECVRIPTNEELVEELITGQLLAEGFAPSSGEEEEANRNSAGVPRPWLPEEDISAIRAISASLVAPGEAQSRLPLKDSVEQPVALDGPPPAKKCRQELEAKDEKKSALEELRQFRHTRAGTESAALTRRWLQSQDFVNANRGDQFCVYHNCVEGNPHKRWVERIAARYTGSRVAASRATDHEGCVPDMARFPKKLPRLAPDEVILTVAVCNLLGHKEQEYDVLASQHLYELRDAFHFAQDWMFDGPTRMKSACFFIDGIFYADKRHPSAIDYSTEIIAWKRHTGERGFLRRDASTSMDVRFCELERIPFGEKCIYVHQGDIERSLYFTNARLVHPANDCPFVEAYPVLTFMRRYLKRRCYACWQNFAMWLVLDSSRCPHNPSFWCARCFRHFHQDANGDYLPPVDYKIFPYLHDET